MVKNENDTDDNDEKRMTKTKTTTTTTNKCRKRCDSERDSKKQAQDSSLGVKWKEGNRRETATD